MKKTKPEKQPAPVSTPVSMSSKKIGALKHEMLFTPYKIQWKNVQAPPTSQVQAQAQPQTNGQGQAQNVSSRTFFNSMKNQLSNYKTYLQQLAKKQISINKVDYKSQKGTGNLQDNYKTNSYTNNNSPNNKNTINNRNEGASKNYSTAGKNKSISKSLCVNKAINLEQCETGKFQQVINKKQVPNYDSINNYEQKCCKTDMNTIKQIYKQLNQKLKQKFVNDKEKSMQKEDRQAEIDYMVRENREQKNIIVQLNKQKQHLYTQIAQKAKIQQELLQELSQMKSQQVDFDANLNKMKQRQLEVMRGQIQNLKQTIIEVEKQKRSIRIKYEQQLQQGEDMRKNNHQLRVHNSFLEQKIQSLSQKMGLVTSKYQQRQPYLRELQNKIQELRRQLQVEKNKYEQLSERYRLEQAYKNEYIQVCKRKSQEKQRQLKQLCKQKEIEHEQFKIAKQKQLEEYINIRQQEMKQYKICKQKQMQQLRESHIQQKQWQQVQKHKAKDDQISKLQFQLKEQIKQLEQKEKHYQQSLQTQVKKIKQNYMMRLKQAQNQSQSIIQQLEHQKQRLKSKIVTLQAQVSTITSNNTNNNLISSIKQQKCCQCQGQDASRSDKLDFSKLGAEFQKKINSLIQQNYGLKNKITNLQSQIVKIDTLNKSYQQQIRFYEDINRSSNPKLTHSSESRTSCSCNGNRKSGNENELQKVKLQLDSLKKEKDKLIQQYQYRIVKLQNQLQQEQQNCKNYALSSIGPCQQPQGASNNVTVTNFNKILKDQLQQNQNLKQKQRQLNREVIQYQRLMKQYQQKIAVLNQQLSVQKMKSSIYEKRCPKQGQSSNSVSGDVISGLQYDLDLLKKKYESVNSMIESKNKLIKNKDQFIQRVLISKANKKQDEDQIVYALKQMKIYRSLIQN